MCGIAGFINPDRDETPDTLRVVMSGMIETLRHRGPDDGDIWFDPETGAALGHRRLSILDVSERGRQPMLSPCGRFVIVYNGEIYNFLEIKKELEQNGKITAEWRSHSDTEVLLAAISCWGLKSAVQKAVGMFAFALWDRIDRGLYLVRDRIGEKPLYYGWLGTTFLFSSELKALKRYPSWNCEVDPVSLSNYMRYSYVPSPCSIYKGIYKLKPGMILAINSGNGKERPVPVPYWQARKAAERGVSSPFSGTEAEAIGRLDCLLRETLKQEMISDVPLGAFLSGGVDSSAVVAIMQSQSFRKVRTFTIGFTEKEYDEARYAKAIAQHLGTEHTELQVTPVDARAIIPDLGSVYDEPFSDSSQIPTLLLSKLTREYVTVSLSGDGGDELFGGYNRYYWGKAILKSIGWIPEYMRKAAGKGVGLVTPAVWEKAYDRLEPILPSWIRHRNPGDKLQKFSNVLSADSLTDMYEVLTSHWRSGDTVVKGLEGDSTISGRLPPGLSHDFAHSMMYQDLVRYLPDDILVKVDRASMAASLEIRVPFLDHRIVEFAWQIPLKMKIRARQGKWILRQVLYQYVPAALIERPKMGFALPIDCWLRDSLKDWAECLLDEKRLNSDGFLNAPLIRRIWREHLTGRRNWQHQLWDVLMFQTWLDAQRN